MKKRMAKKEIPQNETLNNQIVTNETEAEEVPESRGKRIANTVVNAVLVLAILINLNNALGINLFLQIFQCYQHKCRVLQ